MSDQIYRQVCAMHDRGCKTDEINETLAMDIMPKAEHWRRMMLARILATLHDSDGAVNENENEIETFPNTIN
jgi:hypothetical protein